MVDDFHDRHPEDESDVAEEGGYHHRFDEDEPDDGGGPGTERLADTELEGAFPDRDEHDVADAHDTGQQRSETDNPDEHVEPAEYSVHPFELVEVIVEIDGVLVGRGVVVLEREAAQHVILECGHLFVRIDVLEREDDVAYPRVVLHVR